MKLQKAALNLKNFSIYFNLFLICNSLLHYPCWKCRQQSDRHGRTKTGKAAALFRCSIKMKYYKINLYRF